MTGFAGEEFGVVHIGAGGAGMAHLRTVAAHPRCRVVAVADVSPTARAAVESDFAVPTYADYREMLDRHAEAAQVAVVVLPHQVYPEVIEAVVAAGLHILKEKPFARNLDDALRMQRALSGHGGVYMTAGQRLFAPAIQAGLQAVSGGTLGDVYLSEGRILYAWHPDGQNWGWRGDRALSGGTAILDAGWHVLEMLHAFAGQPSRVYAVNGRMRATAGDWTSDDKGMLTLEYADGSVATATACHVALPDRFELLVHGTLGNLEITPTRLTRYDRTAEVDAQEWPGGDLFAPQWEHFLDCVSGTEKPACGLEQSMDIQRTVEAAYQSAATGQPVAIPAEAGR